MTGHVVSVDQGTTSTRCVVLSADGEMVAAEQLEHRQSFPRPGWVEHDALEIWRNTLLVVDGALDRAGLRSGDVEALGITNQRETCVVWDRRTGVPIHPAVVWQDTRTQGLCDRLAAGIGEPEIRRRTGLPVATYFSGPKIRWILDAVDGADLAARRGHLLAGTIDSWLVWNLTGGPDGGLHVTDVTNASRTLLMDLATLDWDAGLAEEVGVPTAMLPQIRSSAEVYGRCAGGRSRAGDGTSSSGGGTRPSGGGAASGAGALPSRLSGVPIAAILGDQHAAMVGQCCFAPGTAKNTYGTGSFLLLNTGGVPVPSEHGLITTVAYRLGEEPPVYALEGSVAVAGALVQWLRDNLGLIGSAAEVEELAASVPDTGDVYVVPAFSGLFAPYWRPDARGTIVGLTRYTTRAHLARACLEATAFQTVEVLEAMVADSGTTAGRLTVDGGMTANDLLLQLQADLLGIPVVRPRNIETTAYGAATAAGLATGVWGSTAELEELWAVDRQWDPTPDADRERRLTRWRQAVTRSLDWATDR